MARGLDSGARVTPPVVEAADLALRRELAEQDGALQHLQQRLGELALPLRTSPVPVAESLQPRERIAAGP